MCDLREKEMRTNSKHYSLPLFFLSLLRTMERMLCYKKDNVSVPQATTIACIS